MSEKQMKAWAIKTPWGRLLLETVAGNRAASWDELTLRGGSKSYAAASGYRCVRVTVTEDEAK